MGSPSPLEGPNPLRPYYVPPSIGLPKAEGISKTSSSSSSANVTKIGRDVIPDFDYSDYLGDSSPSVVDSVRQLLEEALWKYSRTLMSQPFEVAKTIMQVYVAEGEDEKADRSWREEQQQSGDYTDDQGNPTDSDDESNYFASAAQFARSPSTHRHRPTHRITDRSGYVPQNSRPRYMLKVKDPSAVFDVLGQLWSTNGATSLWKASISTFIYSLLLPTLNTFIRSLLCAILGLPEDALSPLPELDILTVSSPTNLLIVSAISSALSSIILSPIDAARTYLILTPQAHGPRSLLRAIRQLPSPNWVIPPHLLPITVISSTLPSLLAQSTPLFLRSYLSLDPSLNPSTWSFFSLIASGLEIGIRIPLETVLRRAQIATFTSPILQQQKTLRARAARVKSSADEETPDSIQTIVPTPQTYRGILGTMWAIVYEEGTVPPSPEAQTMEKILGRSETADGIAVHRRQQRPRKGQGLRGLYRTWRMEMWSIVGIWGSGVLGALLGAADEDVGGTTVDRMGNGVRF
ncbi:hypothetical protein VTO42DRAFT_6392 [Malbranchea cinnamomea]